VLLVDAGARFGALHLLLGVEPARSMESLRGGGTEPEELLVPIAPTLSLLPGGVSPDEGALSPAERRLLFRRVVSLYPRFDVVVVDAGSTLDTVTAACANGVGRFLVVTGADRIATVATYALVKALHQASPALGIEVLPNRYDDDTATRAFEHVHAAAERFLGLDLPLAGAIPDDPLFASALAAGMGALEAADGSSAAIAMSRVGDRLLAELAPVAPRSTSSRGSSLRLQL
jgi:MinD-like ATPase involved in chromosome partitioning or flagellar assembly